MVEPVFEVTQEADGGFCAECLDLSGQDLVADWMHVVWTILWKEIHRWKPYRWCLMQSS